ncbi:MAG TPA: P1 family peptidase [Marmoricola sp.]|nr:P1 family peptidase [Marmoricola sp.]
MTLTDITDVPGIRVGHWTDSVGLTGCTVVLLPEEGAIASVDVRGAAPGTRETDLLQPGRTVERVHAILLTGGSAFGLAAADGVMTYLAERGVGVETMDARVPIVPAAVLYDLGAGSADAHPDAAAGHAACVDAEPGSPCGSGPFGAGTGATVGKLLGPEDASAGGIGSASIGLPGGGVVGAVAAVNAVGDVVAEDGTVLAGALPTGVEDRLLVEGMPARPLPSGNTTLVVVATDVSLTRAQAHRLAVVAHDGLARAIRPVHTSLDGDAVFTVSTGEREEDQVVLETAAVRVVAEAIRRAVR